MDQQPEIAAFICPNCGATRQVSGYDRCWLCGDRTPAVVALPAASGAMSGQPSAAPAVSRFTFGISSVMLLTALVAVILGLFQIAAGLAVLLTVLVVPAFIRIALTASRRRLQGQPMSASEKISWFMAFLGVVTAIGLAAAGAFAAICFAGAFAGSAVANATGNRGESELGFLIIGSLVGGVVGVLAAIFLGIWIGKRLWRYKPGADRRKQ